MSSLALMTIGFGVINGCLALVLGVVYWRNHREIKSPFTMGLLLFAMFLVFHNALLVYHIVTMMATFTTQAEWLVFIEGVFQTVAVGALTYATLR